MQKTDTNNALEMKTQYSPVFIDAVQEFESSVKQYHTFVVNAADDRYNYQTIT
jgi:hypothetical protein